MENIAKAIINVMKVVKSIDKNTTVGTGQSSYKGVSDKDVKSIIGKAMTENGLCIIPTDVDQSIKIDRWEETNQYGTKMKQSILTEVKTKYLLLHESGESLELAGYGQGVDTQDKGAGKATTYALKYALLYAFMVPTGDIDDADKTHSESNEVPKTTAKASNDLVESVSAAIAKLDSLESFTTWGKSEEGQKAKEYPELLNLMNKKFKALTS